MVFWEWVWGETFLLCTPTMNVPIKPLFLCLINGRKVEHVESIVFDAKGQAKPSRVVKTNMMCPFCVGRHVGVHPNMFVVSIRMDVGKSLVTLGLLSLWLATKNKFRSPSFQCVIVALPFTWKNILRQKKNYGNSNISPCKNISSNKIL